MKTIKRIFLIYISCITFSFFGCQKDPDYFSVKIKESIIENEKLSVFEINTHNLDIKDENGKTYLHYATYYENQKVVEQLLKKHADISIQNNAGETAIDIAVDKNNYALVKMLSLYGIENQISIETEIIEGFNSALVNQNYEIATYFSELISKEKINYTYNKNLFFTACSFTNTKALQLLINMGYDINIVDDKGWNALMYAIDLRHPEDFLEFLIANKIEINHINNAGETPLLMSAKRMNSEGYIKLLIDSEADINILDPLGNTALDYARDILDNDDTTRLLASSGAIALCVKIVVV